MTRMRLVKFRTEDGTRAGRLDGDRVVELEDSDVSALLARGYAAVVAADRRKRSTWKSPEPCAVSNAYCTLLT